MKIRSREINTISMSALDMFCAALGAFMFLALLFFAFVPNLGPKAEEVEQLRKQNQTLQQQLQASEQARQQAAAELQRQLDQQATEIAIVVDASGSMTDFIEQLKKDIGDFAHVLGKLTGQARISVIAYRDRCLGGSAVTSLPLTQANDAGVRQIQEFANGIVAQMAPCEGPDRPEESIDGGLDQALALGWKASQDRRYIVIVGDHPAYPDRRTAMMDAARAWGTKGSHLSMVQTAGDPDTAQYYADLARAGNGSALAPGGSFALLLLKAMTK